VGVEVAEAGDQLELLADGERGLEGDAVAVGAGGGVAVGPEQFAEEGELAGGEHAVERGDEQRVADEHAGLDLLGQVAERGADGVGAVVGLALEAAVGPERDGVVAGGAEGGVGLALNVGDGAAVEEVALLAVGEDAGATRTAAETT